MQAAVINWLMSSHHVSPLLAPQIMNVAMRAAEVTLEIDKAIADAKRSPVAFLMRLGDMSDALRERVMAAAKTAGRDLVKGTVTLAKSSAYEIGEKVGKVLSYVLLEVVLAAVTQGIGTAIKWFASAGSKIARFLLEVGEKAAQAIKAIKAAISEAMVVLSGLVKSAMREFEPLIGKLNGLFKEIGALLDNVLGMSPALAEGRGLAGGPMKVGLTNAERTSMATVADVTGKAAPGRATATKKAGGWVEQPMSKGDVTKPNTDPMFSGEQIDDFLGFEGPPKKNPPLQKRATKPPATAESTSSAQIGETYWAQFEKAKAEAAAKSARDAAAPIKTMKERPAFKGKNTSGPGADPMTSKRGDVRAALKDQAKGPTLGLDSPTLEGAVDAGKATLKKKKVTGKTDSVYGTLLHPQLDKELMRRFPNGLPKGAKMFNNVKLKQIKQLSAAEARLTVKQWLARKGVGDPGLSAEVLAQKVGTMKPDVAIRGADGRWQIIDLTSRPGSDEHLAKTIFYSLFLTL
jgi:hypothetical protein